MCYRFKVVPSSKQIPANSQAPPAVVVAAAGPAARLFEREGFCYMADSYNTSGLHTSSGNNPTVSNNMMVGGFISALTPT